MFYGFCFGFAMFIFGTSWVYISFHEFGKAPAVIAMGITVFIVMIMALPLSLVGFITSSMSRPTKHASKHRKNALIALCVFPPLWLFSEWCHRFFHAPFLFLGYTQMHTSLYNAAPIIGVYGLSLITATGCGALALIFHTNNWKHRSYLSLALLLPLILAFAFKGTQWTNIHSKALPIAIVQGDVDQNFKWNIKYRRSILQDYFQQTKKVIKSKSLVILPEAAIVANPKKIPGYMQKIKGLAISNHAHIIVGAITRQHNKKYNSLLLIGKDTGIYHKRHLVPFGEYTLLPGIFAPIFKLVDFKEPNLAFGNYDQQNLSYNDVNIAPLICYEVAYSNEVLQHMANKNIIVAISDNSWFGRSIALDQLLQMTMMRAKETGRYVLAANNLGVSAIISPRGKLIKTANVGKRTTISGKVHAVTGSTPLMKWGYWPTWVACFLLLIFAFFKRKKIHD